MSWRLSPFILLSLFLSRVRLKLMLLRLLNHDGWLFLLMLFTSITAWLWNWGSFIIVVLLVANELLLFDSSVSQTIGLVIRSLRPFVPQMRLESNRFISVSMQISFLFIICIIAIIFIIIIWLWRVMNYLNFCVCWWQHVRIIYQFKILGSQLLLMPFILRPLISHI